MTIWTWSTTAADNDDADATINWAEQQAASTVNNSARAMMAAIAKWRDAMGGAKTTAGSSNAYTLTTGLSITSHQNGFIIGFEASFTNSGAATIAVDGLAAVSIVTPSGAALGSGAITSGGIYLISYESGAGVYILINAGISDATLTAFAAWANGTNKIPYTTATDTFGSLDFLDEDTFSSDSATGVPSQQSTKAYIASQMAGAGLGDVVGPASSTDGYLTIFNGATGKIIAVGGGAPGSLAYLSTINNSNWSGTDLSVANGGTGASTLTGLLSGNGTSAITGSATINNTNWSGTDLSLANGGTGASLADPGADRILFWDDSAGAVTWLTAGTGLTISATTISADNVGDMLADNNLSDVASASTSRSNLGLGSLATANTINNGNWSGTDLAIENGGTGQSTASAAFSALKQSASTSATGVVELATDAEAQAKSDTARVLTASNLAALTSSATFAGLVELATSAEVQTGTDTARAVTPAGAASAYQPIPTSSTLPVGWSGFMEYTSSSALANGDETSGTNVRSPTAGSGATPPLANGDGAQQTGTWKNISGVTLDADGIGNAFGLMVRTA